MKKAQRQSSHSARKPPKMGPSTGPITPPTPHSMSTRACMCRGKVASRIPCPRGIIGAPNSPWADEARTRIVLLFGLVSRVFYYLDRIFEGKGRLDTRNIVGSLDVILASAFRPGEGEMDPAAVSGPGHPAGYVLMAVLILGSWLLLPAGGWTG